MNQSPRMWAIALLLLVIAFEVWVVVRMTITAVMQ